MASDSHYQESENRTMYPVQRLPSIDYLINSTSKNSYSGENYYYHDQYQDNTPSVSNVDYQSPVYSNQWPSYPYYNEYQSENPYEETNQQNTSPLTIQNETERPESPPTSKGSKKGLRQPRKDGVCAHCSTTTTTLWRKNEQGILECNACNLYFRRNGVKRPLNLMKEKPATRNRKRKLAKK